MARRSNKHRAPDPLAGLSPREARATEQAQNEAFLRYAPQEQALAETMAEIRGDFKTGVKQERGIGKMIRHTARSQIKPTRRAYKRTNRAAIARSGVLRHQLQHLGVSADPFLAAQKVEASGARARREEERRSSIDEFRHRIVDSASGQAGAIRNLRRQRDTDITKVRAEVQGILAQKGAFTSAQVDAIMNELRQQDIAKRGQNLTFKAAQERNKTARAGQSETARHHRATEAQAAKGGSKKHHSQFTPTQKSGWEDRFNGGVAFGKQVYRHGDDFDLLVGAIERKSTHSHLLAYAAAQTVVFGGVGPRTLAHLKRSFGIAHRVPKMPSGLGTVPR